MGKYICKQCNATWDEGVQCPNCGAMEENRALVITAAVFGGILLLASVCGILGNFLPSLPEAEPQPVESCAETYPEFQTELPVQTIPEEPTEEGILESGLYEVGVDIPAGEYALYSDGTIMPEPEELPPFFHVSVYNSSALDDDDRAFGGWVSSSLIIRVHEGQFVEVTDGLMYNADAGIPSRLNPFVSDGMFCAGRDMPAGTYTITGTSDQYAGSATYGADFEFVQKGIFNAQLHLYAGETKTITLQEGDYLRMEFCKLEAPVSHESP